MSISARSVIVRKVLPLVWLSIFAAAAWVLIDRLRAIEFSDILRELRGMSWWVLLAGVACACAVYALVGIYEGIAVRLASGRQMRRAAFRTAITANPIARAVGFAILSGGALRYRMYAAEGLSLRQIGAIIVLVAMPYFFSVGWLIDFSLLLNPFDASAALQVPIWAVIALGIAGLVKDVAWLLLVRMRERPLTIAGQQIKLPKLRDALVQLAFGLAQISLMSTILYLFMPPELDMRWLAFVAIYCIAFIAGQLSNVPAGLGVLEAALLLMLPHVPPAKLLGAVLAYRAVYEVLPLLVAVVLLLVYESAHPLGIVRRRRGG